MNLVDLFEHAATYIEQCEACKSVFKRVLFHASGLIDNAMKKQGDHKYDVVVAHMNRGAGGERARTRIDEDFKRHSIVDAVRLGHAHSGSQLLRALGNEGKHQNGPRWQEAHICDIVAAGIREFSSARTCCIAEDGKRLGDNKRENVVYEMWSAEPNKGMYLAPQECVIGIVFHKTKSQKSEV